MKRLKHGGQVLLLVLLTMVLSAGLSCAAFAEPGEKLEFWSEGSPAAASIEEYVKAATDEASDRFIPVEDRIAVFDLDGTIIGELYPSYFEYMMFIHRALYDENYTAPAEVKAFAETLEKGIKTGELPENCDYLHAKNAGLAYAGMTIEEMKDYTRTFMLSRADGFENLKRGDAFYAPMVSLVKYLDANDFTCYIVSGSDRFLVRTVIEDVLPIPENRVIGMSYTLEATGQDGADGLDYVYTKDDEVIRGGDLVIKTIKMNKVSEIALEIGKVPVLAFGNSSGDISMAQYTVNNPDYEGKAYLVLCDDLEREHGSMEKADSMKKTCEEKGFETISMRDDFATIYGDDVSVTDYAYDEANALKGVTKISGKYTEQEYPVFKEKMTDQKIAIRYYEDYPNVPYVGIREYYDCVARESKDPGPETMTVTKEKNGVYHLKSAHGEAVADVVHDTLESDEINDFTNLMCLVQEGMRNGYNDGLPYVRVKDVAYSGSGKALFDFAKYEIEIYGDKEDVYFPVSTLSDIFSDLIYHYSVFNGETFYFIGDNTEDIGDVDPHFADPILAKLDKDLNLPEDLADYSYHELLFSFDHFYGFPGKAILNDEIREVGLEQALKDYGEMGEFTLKMLQSRNYPEHLFGMGRLEIFVGDGGHTVTSMLYFGDTDTSEIYEKIVELKEEYLPRYEDALAESGKKTEQYYFARVKLRDDCYGEKKYIKDGDTAVYVLDDFMGFGEEEWDAYYAGGAMPAAESNDISGLKEALEDAVKDENIKNFVMDLSNNIGGSLDETAMIIGMLSGKREVSLFVDDTLTGQSVVETYELDLNFDGVFDERDEMEPPKLHIAVLTSSTSFSCGNIFPSIMKDAGYPVIGERSGGGACAVLVQTTGEGVNYRMSAFRMRVKNEAGEIIDNGIPVDVDLVGRKSNGEYRFITVDGVPIDYDGNTAQKRLPDYTAFYDLKTLSEAVNSCYENQ